MRKESPKSPKKTQKDLPTSDQALSTKRKSSAVEVSETESRASSRQSKRAKYSTEPSEAPAPVPSTKEPTPSLALRSPYPFVTFSGPVFTLEEVTRATERSKELNASYEAERTSRKEASEAAQKRAIRRANDAERKLLEAGQDFAMKIKTEKALIAQEVATLREERDSAKAQLEAMTADRDTCNKENRSLKEAAASFKGDDALRQQLATQEAQLKLYDQLRDSMKLEAKKPLELSKTLKHEFHEHNNRQSTLTTSVNTFKVDLDDLSNKMIRKSVEEIHQQCQDVAKQQSVGSEAFGQVMEAIESFIAPFTIDVQGAVDKGKVDGATSAGADNAPPAASAPNDST